MKAVVSSSKRAFAAWFKELSFWDARSLRLSQSNHCHWPTVKVSEVCSVRFDQISEHEMRSGDIQLLDRISFEEGKVYSGKRSETKMTQHRAKPGDLVVSKINARKRAIGIVPDGSDIGVTIHFRSLVPDKDKIDSTFLWAALRSKYCTHQFEIETGGVGKGEISEQRLLNIKVPLPSLKTQRAIVTHWKESQSEIAASLAATEQLEKGIARYICKALGSPMPADKCLAPRHMALQWKDLERWSFNYLVRSNQGLLGFHKSAFPIVPLSECLENTTNGYCIKPVAGPTPHKMLKLNALAPSGLDLTKTKYISVPDKIAKRFSLRKDDLLICRSVGSYDQVAKCALVEEDCQTTLFPDIIIRARLNSKVLPRFVREVMQTPLGRSHFLSNARTAVGMWKIGAEDIRNFPLPLPPLDVQREIVNHLAEIRSEIARTREAVERKTMESKSEIEAMILGTKKPLG